MIYIGLISTFPDLLAGEQINPAQPRRWLLIKREAAIPDELGGGDRWSLDHLFIDQDAIPTLVEVKRQSDTRLRREVIGQVLDYAANAIAYWPGKTLQSYFYETVQQNNQDPERVLIDFLQDTFEPEEFWLVANDNLRRGNVRLLFVSDRIPSELIRIVEFLNERMSPTEVLALELRRYHGGRFSTHIPRILGQTTAAQIAKQEGIPPKSARRRFWNEGTFFEDAAKHLEPAQVECIHNVLEFCLNNGFNKIDWGTGIVEGSFSPKNLDISRLAPITLTSRGNLRIKLGWLTDSTTASSFCGRFQEKLKQAGLPYAYETEPGQEIKVSIEEWTQWGDQLLEAMHNAAQEELNPTVSSF